MHDSSSGLVILTTPYTFDLMAMELHLKRKGDKKLLFNTEYLSPISVNRQLKIMFHSKEKNTTVNRTIMDDDELMRHMAQWKQEISAKCVSQLWVTTPPAQ